MDSMKEWWTINDFARVVSEKYNQRYETSEKALHYNTIYNWFNELEYQRIHFVQRLDGNDKKIFDDIDLEIAIFIKSLRNKKWTIDQIMAAVPKQCEVRGFPEGDIHLPSTELSDIEKLMRAEFESMKRNMESKLEQRLNAMLERRLKLLIDERLSERETDLFKKMEILEKALPAPKTEVEINAEQVSTQLTQARFLFNLQNEALAEWKKRNESDRTVEIKTGWFSKKRVEDTEKREEFINNYINERLNTEG